MGRRDTIGIHDAGVIMGTEMMIENTDSFDLEGRFREPAAWQWGSFKTGQGRVIRTAMLEAEDPAGCVVVLQGMGEFIEKYFEVARDLKSRGLSVYTLD